MASFLNLIKRWSHSVKAVLLTLTLSLTVERAGAVDDTFYNNSYLLNYTTPINATNFINDSGGVFSYTMASSINWLSSLYAGWPYTKNFTNSGELDCNTGFRFDTQSPSHIPAQNFYNLGPINCGTSTNSIFFSFFTLGGISFGGYGGLYVSATNIFNSGAIVVGSGGLAKLQGDNIDFNRGSIDIQTSKFVSTPILFNQFTTPNIYATGQTDNNTNDWDPSLYLSQNFAYAPLNSTPYGIFLVNSTPYFQDTAADNTQTNRIIRMVFLQDNSVNVTTNVYFESSTNGSAHIEWVGTYTDQATGTPITRYLYLDDDYKSGSSTNILKYGDPGTGVPANFTFITSDTQRVLGTAETTFFPNGFLPAGNLTNFIYSYVNAQFSASTVSTNQVLNGSLTNLPARVEITAAKNLNLELASLTGMNYLLLKSTNQFTSDGQSTFGAPYSDMYLGSTNGNLTITNLLPATIPNWVGTVQAWNSRFFFTNTTLGVNYDVRILLVASQLSPTTVPFSQDFVLYGSNNVVISDALNITRTFSLNCTNLLLTTNGFGSASLEGELNLLNPSFSWATSVPRLRYLTNNGAIRTTGQNVTQFGNSGLRYFSFINNGVVSNGFGTVVYANQVQNNGGLLSSGGGSLILNASTISLPNSQVFAGGVITNISSSLLVDGASLQAGKSITLLVTNLLTDNGVVTNSNWSLGSANSGSGVAPGLVLPIKPVVGDLLATTITNIDVGNTMVVDIWAGQDRGYSVSGFSNNAAIGQLVLDARGPNSHTQYALGGASVSNAIYIDNLQLINYATNHDASYNLTSVVFSNNLVIYYAQAMMNGVSVAEKLNHKNNDHLRWVPAYAGRFSSVALVYPDGSTNVVNAALAAASDIDSDGDGVPNSVDPTPFFTASQLAFNLSITNMPPVSAKLEWVTIPNATNYIFYKTNLLSPTWLPLSNFPNYYYGASLAVTNAARLNSFTSPQAYPGAPTTVWIFDPVTNMPHFYRVMVQPWNTYPF